MRIDPKYFNRFIGICALLTVLAIVYSTVRYSQKQVNEFNESIATVDFRQLSFNSFTESDSVRIEDVEPGPVIIHFWSTWSKKSKSVNRFLHEYQQQNGTLTVIAAAVRDDESLIREYIQSKPYSFIFVDGTEFYQKSLVPGMPSQIFLSGKGQFFDAHVGDDTIVIGNLLDQLLSNP